MDWVHEGMDGRGEEMTTDGVGDAQRPCTEPGEMSPEKTDAESDRSNDEIEGDPIRYAFATRGDQQRSAFTQCQPIGNPAKKTTRAAQGRQFLGRGSRLFVGRYVDIPSHGQSSMRIVQTRSSGAEGMKALGLAGSDECAYKHLEWWPSVAIWLKLQKNIQSKCAW